MPFEGVVVFPNSDFVFYFFKQFKGDVKKAEMVTDIYSHGLRAINYKAYT